jgi:hypothetical protein
MLLGDGCQAVGVALYLLNGSKLVQLVEAFSCPVIDDKVLGITQFGDYGVRGEWYVDDTPWLEEYNLKWTQLINFSEALKQWRRRRA